MAQSFNLTARINMAGPYNLRPIVSKIKKDIGAIKPELKFKLDATAASGIKKITTEIKKLDSATKSAQKSVGSLNTQLNSLAASFNSAATASKNAANATASVGRATAKAAQSANQARTAIEEFGKQSGLAIKRFAAFSSVTSIIFGVTNAITDAYKEFLIFNKEIVRLSQVTDKSVSDLKGISNEITRLSTSIGVASSDLITVASTLAQAGLSAQDTKIALEALAKSALAPSFENIIDTTEGAIAAIRQFGLETSQLEGALGSINAVAAAFAVEAGDIIAAIQRTGGVFASASRGVSEGTDALNEFIAIFTSIRQTTRESAETIATGLRTIFTRIQRSSTIELLKQYGVELRDLEGKFVGPYEAVRRLSDGLSRIDPRSADFARISEELGGFRQIGKVIPLIQQFSVAQDALNVAQKGSGSLTRDVQTAQQSLAVQFAKTRENFLALVREIGDSQSFKTIVSSTLFLTNGLIDLGRALKPLIPLLLTFGAIKVGGAFNQFFGTRGFGGVFGLGGGGGGTGGGAIGAGGGGGGGAPGGGNQPLTSALSTNTTATNVLNQTLVSLNTAVLALNQNIVNTNSLLLNRPTRGFATGGLVPGSGNRDTVRANLTPGEFVIRKSAVQAIGAQNLAAMNSGGEVQKFMAGSPGGVRVPSGKGRGKKVKKGARSRYDLPQPGDKDFLAWAQRIYAEYDADPSLPRVVVNGIPMPPELAYVDRLISQEVFEKYGSGMMLGYDAKGNEVIGRFSKPEPSVLEAKEAASRQAAIARRKTSSKMQQKLFRKNLEGVAKGSAAGLLTKEQIEILSPENLAAISKDAKDKVFSIPIMQKEVAPANTGAQTLLSTLQAPLSAFRKSGGQTSLAGAFPGSSAAKIKAAIPQYIASLGDEPQKVAKAKTALQYFDSFKGGGTADKPGHATAFTETVNQILKSGLVQEFAEGGKAQINDKLKQQIIKTGGYEQFISQSMFDPNNLGLNSQIANFGMVGLRSGTKSSANRTENRKLENGKRVRIHVGFLQSQNDPNFRSIIENDINKSLQKTILKTAGKFGQDINASIDPKTKDQILEGAVLSSAVGSVFESALQMIGAPYIDKVESIKSMDFPFGLGNSSKLFGSFPNNIPTDATRTIAGSGKGISDFLGQINRFFTAIGSGKFTQELEPLPTPQALSARQMAEALFGSVKANPSTQSAINSILVGDRIPGVTTKQTTKRIDSLADDLARKPETIKKLQAAGFGLERRAMGGGISGEDTVPALLTPGEFVFNKDSAQRIGYGTLNKLNKVKGYNKGGIVNGSGVQTFANGGAVFNNPAVIGAALGSVLLPQVQKLADTFIKLEGTAGEFGVVLGGAIREASSTILSASIALEAVGASRTTRNLAIGAGGLVSGVSGAISDSSAKALEKALLSNTSAINKFETNLQDIANAPTEELRAEAAARLEKSFNSLDISVRNSKDNIDRLENLKNFSDSMQNINMVILTTITAMTALSAASSRAKLAMEAGGALRGLASNSTKFLSAISGLIGPIGILVGVISVGIEVWGFFNNRLKSSNEQFDRLNKALDETVKNSAAYNLGNKNFVENILPRFQNIVNDAAKLKPADRQEFIRNRIAQLPSTSPLDLRFRQRLIPRLSELSIGMTPDETVQDIEQKVVGTTAEIPLRKIIKQLEEDARIADATAQLVEKEGMDRVQAEKKINELARNDQNELTRLAKVYNATKLQEILSARLLADAANRVQVSLVNLDNMLTRTTALNEKSLSKLTNSFEDLDSRIGLLTGEVNVDITRRPTRDIQVLQNLIGSSNQEVVDIMRKFTQNANLPGNIGKELTDQIIASQTLEKQMGIVLNTLAERGEAGNLDDLLKNTLGKALQATIGTGIEAQNTIDTILREVGSNLNASLATGNAPKTLKELASTNKTLDATYQSGQRSLKFVIDSLDIYSKGLKLLSEQQKKTIELENQIRQKTLQRIEAEKKASIQFREIFDIEVPLTDRLDIFNAQIRQQTSGVAGLPAGGTTNVTDINAARQRVAIRISELEQQDKINKLTGDQGEELRKNISQFEILTGVIEQVANGGEQVNLVFEAIAKQRDQFKTQREVLIDILKRSRDPAQQLQLQAEFEAIQAVASGGPFSEAQAFRALESNLLRIFSGPQQEAITQAILTGLGKGARPSTPAETSAINRVLIWLANGGLTMELATTLRKTTGNVSAAINIQTEELEKAKNLRIQQSIKLLDQFNTSLEKNPQLVTEFIEGAQGLVAPKGQVKASVTSRADLSAILRITDQLASLGRFVSLPGEMSSGVKKELLFNTSELSSLRSSLSAAQNKPGGASMKELGIILQQAIAQKGGNLSPEFQNLSPELNRIMKEVSAMIQESKRVQQMPQTPAVKSAAPRMEGASLGTRNIDRFSTSATQLATALTGDNTNITQLTAAVGSLKPATDNLINAVAELKTLFKDGKIQVSQETKGEVSVNFNNSLPIERDANADSRFLDQISRIAQDTIGQKLNSFIRELLT